MPPAAAWADQIPSNIWTVYREALSAANKSGIPFALGGSFALAAYTGVFRTTKDIDLYITPDGRDAVVSALTSAGFTDLYEEQNYDRAWIYRCKRDGCIVDTIWAMENTAARVDESWLAAAPALEIRGEELRVLPAEELIWTKLYVLQRDRCDWPDIFNIIYPAVSSLDWPRLMARLGDDLT